MNVENEKRICKKCKLEKDLKNDFRFHSPTGYYSRTCKDCTNEEVRLNRPLIAGRREGSKFIKQKICAKCGIAKDTNKENFTRTGGTFSKVCRECTTKLFKKPKKDLAKGYLPDTAIKKCNICNQEKSILDFYFNKKQGYYSYCCIKCDYDRKIEAKNKEGEKSIKEYRMKRREIYYKNRTNSILARYKKFDFERGLENDLTKEYIESQLVLPCEYCGYPTTGLDRKDSSLGHTIENCVPSCLECNTMKMDNFTHEEMLFIGKTVKEIKDKRINNG